MSAGHQPGRLRRLHSRTKSCKQGLSQFISGRSASFQSLQLVVEGELGDSTAALSKEWQALTPRSALSDSSGTPLSARCLDSLLDGIAELSTSAADGGSSGGASSASVRGGCSFASGRRTSGDSPSCVSGQHVGDLQVVPMLRGDMSGTPFTRAARSYDTGLDSFGWDVPAERSNSMDSCSGSRVKQ